MDQRFAGGADDSIAENASFLGEFAHVNNKGKIASRLKAGVGKRRVDLVRCGE